MFEKGTGGRDAAGAFWYTGDSRIRADGRIEALVKYYKTGTMAWVATRFRVAVDPPAGKDSLTCGP